MLAVMELYGLRGIDMGQTYSVEAHFVFPNGDNTAFCEAMKKRCNEWRKVAIIHDSKDYSDDFEMFKVICPNAMKYGDIYSAFFDGTYGWFDVVWDVFNKAFDTLADGSYIDAEGDDNVWFRISIVDGEKKILGENLGDDVLKVHKLIQKRGFV